MEAELKVVAENQPLENKHPVAEIPHETGKIQNRFEQTPLLQISAGILAAALLIIAAQTCSRSIAGGQAQNPTPSSPVFNPNKP